MENLENKTKEQLLKEIDQLKTKVVALEKSELKNRLWLENSPVCTKIVDLDFNLQYMSSSGVRELKIDDITEFYGKPYPLHFYPDSFKIPMRNNLKKAKETGKTIVQEAPIVDIKGNTLWYQSTIVPVYNDKGQLDYLMVVSLETTERKQAEEKLIESEEKFKTLVTNNEEIVYIIAKDGTFLLSEGKGLSKLGIKPGQVVGESIYDLYKGFPDMLDEMQRAFKGETIYSEVKIGDIYFKNWYSPHKDSAGKIIGLLGLSVNITEQKKTAEELLKSEERFDLAMKATKDGIFDWDLINNTIYYSPGWKSMLGYEDNELANDFSIWEKLTKPEDVKKSWEIQNEVINKKRDRFEMEFKMKHKDGHWVDIHARSEPIFNESGEAVRMVGTHVDITERKLAEEEIKIHRDNLEQLVKDRTAEVDEKNKKLNDQMKVFVGREQKIRDLEKRIKLMGGKI